MNARDAGAAGQQEMCPWYNPVDRITMRFDDYPIPGSWQLAARGVAPVQTKFVQAVWRTHKDSIDSSAGVRR